MNERAIRRINLFSFLTALATIVVGVGVAVLGIWGAFASVALFWKVLGTDGTLFGGAVLTNLAIACYRKPGGATAT